MKKHKRSGETVPLIACSHYFNNCKAEDSLYLHTKWGVYGLVWVGGTVPPTHTKFYVLECSFMYLTVSC